MTNLASNLFAYLRELTSLRHKVVRSIDEYQPFVLWFADVPREKECLTPAWFLTSENNVPEDIWLMVQKTKAPQLPVLPIELRQWVDESQLINVNALPEPHKRIDNPGRPSESIEFKYFPKLEKIWLEYLEKKWLLWAEEKKRVGKIQKIYMALHEIYQEKKKLGEQYELILGMGLLCWNTPNNQKVMRHLIIAEADIVLDANKGTITVGPGIGSAGERAKTTFEQEMLEANQRPSPDVQNSIESQISEIGNNIWNSELVDSTLKSWLEEVSSSNESIYYRTIAKPNGIKENPSIYLAPCLMLRKRTERGLLKILDDISKKLLDQEEIPANICTITGLPQKCGDESGSVNYTSDEIHFPLPCNDEQVKIVEQVKKKNAVLVQGPPGTGKSHTIVNLICHFLADGKRILVTSQTPRALRVLQDMMESKAETKSIAALCVSILGNDSKSLKNLENSVHSISDKQYTWNIDENKEKINNLKHKLDNLKREEAKLKAKLQEMRYSETESHNLFSGRYNGTLQQIAIRVSQEKLIYSWIEGVCIQGDEPILSDQEVIELLNLMRYFTKERSRETEKLIPSSSSLPPVKDFVRYSDYEKKLHAEFCKREAMRKEPFYRFISQTVEEKTKSLILSLKNFIADKENVEKHIKPWAHKALDDILAEQDRSWRVLLENTKNMLFGLAERATIADQTKIHEANAKDRTVILSDARQLFNYLENGGKIKRILNSIEVKNALYLIKATRVNGRLCDNKDSLKLLIECLETDEKLEILWNYWSHVEKKPQRSRAEQVAMIEDMCEPIEASLNLYNTLTALREICQSIVGLPEPLWRDTVNVRLYINAAETAICEMRLRETHIYFSGFEDKIKPVLANKRQHEICEQFVSAIRNRDPKQYSYLHERLQSIEKEKKHLAKKEMLFENMQMIAPKIATDIQMFPEDPAWETKLADFNKSWFWKKADCWMKERLDGTLKTDINSEIERKQKQIKQVTGEIASKLAWGHCVERLARDEKLGQHLRGWADSVKRYGKGTGKNANKHLRTAREHMDKCRQAIPAWIMPLYRVADTVSPERGAYDVVIIDEASQSGPEALFLFYIAKKVIVVGDDKQISPENVGILEDDVENLLNKYMGNYSFKSHYGTKNSLFTIADIFFSGRIVLREHFRCMPEIIQFSNNHFYSNTQLIPLRQYPPERLDPIKHVHVRDGYREGVASDAINRPEAEAIVKTIKQCCDDTAYKEKSMGVITLLGNKQAALIEKLLLENITPETIEKRNIVCGNPYAFQGDERDIIFLSMVAAPGNVSLKALVMASDERRFNVAASRAKDQVWLFHTPALKDFRNDECLRYKLLSYYMNPKVECAVGSAEKCESEFERAVFGKIAGRGFRVIPQFLVAGYHIDLVVQGMKGQLAVECDGDHWHGPEQYEKDMARQRVLERCGWTFFRIRGGEFYRNPDTALDPLWNKLQELRIAPGGQDIITPTYPSVTNDEENGSNVDVESNEQLRLFDEDPGQKPIERKNEIVLKEKSTQDEIKKPDSFTLSKSNMDNRINQITQTEKRKITSNKVSASSNVSVSSNIKDRVKAVKPDVWIAIADWAKVNNYFLGRSVRLLYNIGSRTSKNQDFTEEEAASAMRLYDAAMKRGFRNFGDSIQI